MTISMGSNIRLMRKAFKSAYSLFKIPKPNEHLSADTATLIKVKEGMLAYVRPSFSDDARLSEFNASIYVPSNEFTKKVAKSNPSLVVDVGANIGLSSLSLFLAFPSVTKVIGVEAELENHSILSKNYKLWSEYTARNNSNSPVLFEPLYAVASDKSEKLSDSLFLSKLEGGVSASGTFRFTEVDRDDLSLSDDALSNNIEFSKQKICLSDLLGNYLGPNDHAVLKVDIEGGEQELFQGDCDWLDRTVYLTVEIHDRFGLPNSSRNILRNIVGYDFAIVPDVDVLHCYNRKILGF